MMHLLSLIFCTIGAVWACTPVPLPSFEVDEYDWPIYTDDFYVQWTVDSPDYHEACDDAYTVLLLPTSKNACGDNLNWNFDDAVMSTTVPVTKGDLYVPEYEMTRFSPGATSTVDCVIATDYYYDTPWCTRLAFIASSTSYDSVLPSATQQSSTQTSSPEATSGVTKSADKSSEDERRDVDIGTGVSFGILGLGILTFTSVRVKRKGWRSLKFWSWKKA